MRDEKPAPVERWAGHVTEVDGDRFTAELLPDGGGAVFLADFSMTRCGITVIPGSLILVTPQSVTVLGTGAWTKRQLRKLRREAHQDGR